MPTKIVRQISPCHATEAVHPTFETGVERIDVVDVKRSDCFVFFVRRNKAQVALMIARERLVSSRTIGNQLRVRC